MTFIDHNKIKSCIEKSSTASNTAIEETLTKALTLKGLSLEEAAILLNCKDEELTKELYKTAGIVKEKIYGSRLVLFTPLYLSDKCVNSCLYCGFKKNGTNKGKTLSLDEIKNETASIINDGHKRLLLVAAEDAATTPIDYIEKAIEAVYSVKSGSGEIRRININIAPLPIEDFKRLKKTGIGTYQLFQETYHRETYEQVHLAGPKSDYDNRLYAMHRAMEAGIDDVGIGTLFGLHDYKYDVLSLIEHSLELESKFGAGPHTISIPRIESAAGSTLSQNPPSPVTDEELKKIVAVLRLAVPYTGIILSTRETPMMRGELIRLGVSQLSANSKTSPGGHANAEGKSQFKVADSRSTEAVIMDMAKKHFSPSFCTACYRTGRTGKNFMDMAKPGDIQKFCLPNSILSFKEYLLDYAGEELKKLGDELISEELRDIKEESLREATEKKLRDMEKGGRDYYF